MSNTLFNLAAPKKSANFSINTDLLRQAQRSQWLEENQRALEEYNRRIETSGTFSDGLRRF